MRHSTALFALPALVSALCAPACRAEPSRAAQDRPKAIAFEFLGGAALGTAGAYLGGYLGAATGDCVEGDSWFGLNECSEKLGRALLGALIGNAAGTTLGVSLAGSAYKQGGSPGLALAASLVGNLVSIPLAFKAEELGVGPALAVFLLVPAIASTLGYQTGVSAHLQSLEDSETSLRMREGAVRLAAAQPLGGLRKDGFRAELLTLRF